MRPRRIQVQGFSTFRRSTAVDFTDVDLFAFVGPTGAGKSSLIDAMVFALYGSVPRYDDDRLVAPVITQGEVEARVRFDFTLDGHEYTAVRRVQRTATGATTKEARLECDGEVLVGDAKGLTAAVVDLLGLDLGQFTKCVVLPQGAFAQLLHDPPSKRQDLLVRLLDLGLYEAVAAAARGRARDAAARRDAVDRGVQELGSASDDDVAAAEARLTDLQALVADVDEQEPVLADLGTREAAAASCAAEAAAAVVALQGLAAPADVDEVAVLVSTTAAALAGAEQAEEATRARLAAAEDAVAAGDRVALVHARDAHQRLREVDGRIAKGRAVVDEHRARGADLTAAAEARAAEHDEARAALDRGRVEHAAAALARHLHAGDPCPVCGQAVPDGLSVTAPEMAQAEAALRATASAHEEATAAVHAHERELASLVARLESLVAEEAELAPRVTAAAPPDEIACRLAALDAAEVDVAAARGAEREARVHLDATRKAATAATDGEQRAWKLLRSARDAVIAHEPPPVDEGSLGAAWATLVDWGVALGAARAAERDAAGAEVAALREQRDALQVGLVEQAAAAGVAVTGGRVRDACVQALTRAEVDHEHALKRRDDGVRLRAERDEAVAVHAVHHLLHQQLDAGHFEQWLLDEALTVLVDGATIWLERLSSGRYALAVGGGRDFVVVDHANADERRLARTLSGGETFLASLALALALAEHVTQLSATGGTRLEAIFLDEGFGTLDPETLDVVATAIEELGASGRMVGVVSHVRELAERVPVRFEVAHTGDTSTVDRVEA